MGQEEKAISDFLCDRVGFGWDICPDIFSEGNMSAVHFPWDHRCYELRIAKRVYTSCELIKFLVLLNLWVLGKRLSQV